jgi:cytochrome b
MSVLGGVKRNDETAAGQSGNLRVWDLPTRILHWALVVSIAACWWTGIHNELQYHLYSGYVALWIVLMRMFWGIWGSSTARFVNFVRGPKAILNYARTLHRRDAGLTYGHNALGAISVVVMLCLVLAVIGIGLFAVDVDGLYSGPLSVYVNFRTGRHLAHLHYNVFTYLLAIIGLHLLAVLFYYIYKRQNLVFPMVTGKHSAQADIAEELKFAPLWLLLLGAGLSTAIVWAVSTSFYF